MHEADFPMMGLMIWKTIGLADMLQLVHVPTTYILVYSYGEIVDVSVNYCKKTTLSLSY